MRHNFYHKFILMGFLLILGVLNKKNLTFFQLSKQEVSFLYTNKVSSFNSNSKPEFSYSFSFNK